MNIINGDSAGGCLKQAFQLSSEELLIFRDVLSCGPITSFDNSHSWIKFREIYWHKILADNAIEPYSFEESPRDFFVNIDELNDANKIILWIGSGLSDQLLLAFIVNLLVQKNIDVKKLSVVQFHKLDGLNYEIHGIGLLHPDNIKRHSRSIKLSKDSVDVCLNAWKTFVDDSPDTLVKFLENRHPTLPLMFRAMAGLLYRYPNITNGLTYWDEALLAYTTAEKRKAARIIGNAMCHDSNGSEEWVDKVGDLSLLSWLKDLARPTLNQPLLDITSIDFSMRETEVSITKFGIDVKEGRANKVKTNGINEWIGGVHLDSSMGGTWFRDGERLTYQPLSYQ